MLPKFRRLPDRRFFFVTLVLPRELVARWVGHESGFPGLLDRGLLWLYPARRPDHHLSGRGAFLVMGADAGAVVTFIVSWTLIG